MQIVRTDSFATVEDALDFVQTKIESIMNGVSDLTARDKRRLRLKIHTTNLKCMDHKRVCRDSNRGGIDRHLFNSAVVVCYNNIRDALGGQAFCKLADIVLHEIAHSAGVNKTWGHNNGPNGDRVYRTGESAYSRCVALGQQSSIPFNTNN